MLFLRKYVKQVSDQNLIACILKFKLAILKHSPHYQSISLGSEQNRELMGTQLLLLICRRHGFEPKSIHRKLTWCLIHKQFPPERCQFKHLKIMFQ